MKLDRHFVLGILSFLAMPVLAVDFDGSKPLICATMESLDCVRGDQCLSGLPEDVGAPAFMRLDFAKKMVIGPKRSSPVLLMEKTEKQLLLQGREVDFGWTIALNSANGEMTLTLVNYGGAYVLFGSCTPL